MPLNITPDTPRRDRTISGVLVKVPAPFKEGDVMTPALASIVNQTIAENFSNNLRERIKAFVPEGAAEGTKPRQASAEEAQALVDKYAETYEPGVRTGGGGRTQLSPVEKEMRVIAREKLNELLSSQNIKRSQIDNYADLVEEIVNDHEDALRTQAERIVAAREKASKGADLDLGKLNVQTKDKEPAAASGEGEGE